MARLKVAVLVSGRGSNLQALIDACAAPDAPAEIVLVVSNVAGAGGIDRAARAGIPTQVIEHKAYAGRAPFEAALDTALRTAGVGLVCLAGFMRILTDGFVDGWRDRLINIHPSLLPAYRGLDTHRRAIEDGVRFTGCTVHFVRPEMDDGPIIAQAAVPIHPDDTPDSLAARVLQSEHRLYPLALTLFAEGRLRVEGRRVLIAGSAAPARAAINPDPAATLGR